MPRVKKEVEKVNKSKDSATSNAKQATSKKSSVANKKTTTKVATKKVTAKKSTSKKAVVSKKSTTSSTTKKVIPKTKKTAISSKKSSKGSKVSAPSRKNKEKNFINVLEYYDLPYRYNETVVKILAQTPKVLFVYWDISDSDRLKYIEKYGEYFFNDSYPVLIVYNKTLNYFQEVEINDFANSWYISIPDSRSEYVVELGRRFKEYATRNPNMKHKEDVNKRLSIAFSNNLVAPNDHPLIGELKNPVLYRNVKTNEESYKSIINILKNGNYNWINFYNLYKEMYKVEDLNILFSLNNPSSGNPTSTFK